MKLLYAHDHKFYKYNDDYYSNGSFPKEVLLRYTNIFEDVRFVSRQVLIHDKPNKMSLATVEGINFVKVPNFKSSKTLHKRIKVNNIIEREVKRSDCVIARLPSSIGSMAVKYAKKHNKPYLIEVVGCVWDALWNHGSVTGKIVAPYSFLKTRKIISKSKYTIYITKEFLQSRYPSHGRISIAPNVSINQVNRQILDSRIKRINDKEDQDVMVFGLIGSLDVSYKGHEVVIKALSLIKDKIPEFRMEFLGAGNQERWISLAEEYEVDQYIRFLGLLPSGDAVYNWMDSLDISLQPSNAEAQGRSIIEAMSRGCPVIATKVGGIVELIDHDWLINAGDYTKLSEKILELVGDKGVLRNQAMRNFEEAKQYYKDNIDRDRYLFLKEFKEDVNSNWG